MLSARDFSAQHLFLTTRQTLNLHLAFQRSGFIGTRLDINQLHWVAASRVFRSCTGIMGNQTVFQVVGNAAIQSVIGAAEKVADPTRCHFRNPSDHCKRPFKTRALRCVRLDKASMVARIISTAALPQRTNGVLPV